MSDNLTRYCAIQTALRTCRDQPLTGHSARHLNTLAALVSGIVGSQSCQLPAVARKTPGVKDRDSQVMQFRRWLNNERIDRASYYHPYVRLLLASLPDEPVVLVIDSSQVGRGRLALVISVLYRQRALPLCRTVVSSKKGHVAESVHVGLLQQAAALVPRQRPVIFLGDGEFNGTDLLAFVEQQGWHFVCRVPKNTVFAEGEEWFSLAYFPLQPGDCYELEDIRYTQQGYGPLLLVAVWQEEQAEPLCLVSNLEFLEEVLAWYQRRFTIETLFSDQKSRGFGIDKSHLSDPKRLERLLLATSLAYLWMICLGAYAKQSEPLHRIHRKSRCDLSLFQIGLRWLDYCLSNDMDIPVPLQLPHSRAA